MTLQHHKHKHIRGIVMLALVAAAFLGAASPVLADPLLFDSMATIAFSQQSGGTYYYDLNLSTDQQDFRELYLVLDPVKVVAGASASVALDAKFLSAELLSQPGVNLFFSQDHRSVANINNSRLLDQNLMDSYDPLLTDPLPDGTRDLTVRLGMNRALSTPEMYRIGYWVGDLRGMLDEQMPFTESDGNPVPEPATLVLALGGLAGLYGSRRRKRRER